MSSDADVFHAQKERFLREARILRDFSNLSAIVRVLDYFEANNTAYIVMEYVEGVTLLNHLEDHGGRLDAEVLLRRALPLVESLKEVHACGIIHRDISPDNIMVLPDGALKLIDFGAARAFSHSEAHYSTIAKVSYAPVEQYDPKGRQGSWTDVYALCATLYHCIVGTPPIGSVQRMFLDELKLPSQVGIQIAPKYERIIMKGLQLDAARRYQSMAALSEAIGEALPRQKGGRSRLALGFAAGCVFLALIFCAWQYWHISRADRFRGIETERIILTIPDDTSAVAYSRTQTQIENWLEDFAGPDNYIMAVNGTHVDVTVPLSTFDGQEIRASIQEGFKRHLDEENSDILEVSAQIRASWEDPASSLIAGKNQVLPAELHEGALDVACAWGKKLTRGQRANLLVDFKDCLDALEVPYAFGTLYGDDEAIVFRLPLRRACLAILDILIDPTLYICGECKDAHGFMVQYNDYTGGSALRPIGDEAAPEGFRYAPLHSSDTDLDKLLRTLDKGGEDQLYIRTTRSNCAIARASVGDVSDDYTVDFTRFQLSEEDAGWLIRFIDTALNRTSMPSILHIIDQNVVDAAGNALLGEVPFDHYGLRTDESVGDAALKDALKAIEAAEGYPCWLVADSGVYLLQLDLEPNELLARKVEAVVPPLIEQYGLSRIRHGRRLMIQLADEIGRERCRIFLYSGYDWDNDEIHESISCTVNDYGRMSSCCEELRAWWNDFDAQALGLRKN